MKIRKLNLNPHVIQTTFLAPKEKFKINLNNLLSWVPWTKSDNIRVPNSWCESVLGSVGTPAVLYMENDGLVDTWGSVWIWTRSSWGQSSERLFSSASPSLSPRLSNSPHISSPCPLFSLLFLSLSVTLQRSPITPPSTHASPLFPLSSWSRSHSVDSPWRQKWSITLQLHTPAADPISCRHSTGIAALQRWT